MNNWICCQLGVQKDYAIPRILHNQGQLKYLITDAWINSFSTLNLIPDFLIPNLRDRYHPELSKAHIKAVTNPLIIWELSQKFKNMPSWERVMSRNLWWQEQVLKILPKLKYTDKNTTLFAYSYAALNLFKYAKSQGWKTVLGQVDPGIIEEKLVIQQNQTYPQYSSHLQLAPLDYWQNWRQECILADQIIVNSSWSAETLQQTGVDSQKITIVPLASQTIVKPEKFTRTYPQSFSQHRPLKVLFLGQVILRKGVAAIFEAIEILANKPIEFWFVGQIGINIPRDLKKNPKIKWIGAVSHGKTNHYYQQADVFLFPTLSDNFGITQLEAQTWQLPLITSQFCGSVVRDRINGLILPEVTGDAIAKALNFCFYNPQQLDTFAQASHQVSSDFDILRSSSRK